MEDCTFIYGQLISFGALEKYKVYEDDLYVIYDATDLFYRDLDRYIDDFLSMREDVYFDDAVRSWVHGVYDYYHDPENLSRLIVCHSLEENPCFVPSPAE